MEEPRYLEQSFGVYHARATTGLCGDNAIDFSGFFLLNIACKILQVDTAGP